MANPLLFKGILQILQFYERGYGRELDVSPHDTPRPLFLFVEHVLWKLSREQIEIPGTQVHCTIPFDRVYLLLGVHTGAKIVALK